MFAPYATRCYSCASLMAAFCADWHNSSAVAGMLPHSAVHWCNAQWPAVWRLYRLIHTWSFLSLQMLDNTLLVHEISV